MKTLALALAVLCAPLHGRPVPVFSMEDLRDSSTHAAAFKVIKVTPSGMPRKGSPYPEVESYVAHTATCELISPVKGELAREFNIRFFVYEKPMFNGSVCAYLELFQGSAFLGFLRADPDAPGEFMGCMGHLDEGLAFRPLDVPPNRSWIQEVQEKKRLKYEAKKSQ